MLRNKRRHGRSAVAVGAPVQRDGMRVRNVERASAEATSRRPLESAGRLACLLSHVSCRLPDSLCSSSMPLQQPYFYIFVGIGNLDISHLCLVLLKMKYYIYQ